MVIQIQCPSCSASFPVDPDKIPEGGVNARCSSCGHVFRVERPTSIDDLAPDPAPETVAEPEPEVEAEPEPEVEPEWKPEPEPEWEPEPEPESEVELEWKPEPEPEAEPEWERQPEPEPFGVEPEEEITIMADFSSEAAAEPDALVEADDDADEGTDTSSLFGGGAPADTEEASVEPAMDEEAAVEEAPVEEDAPKVSGFSFGRRDPKDKAKRLARVLVSDMTMYNADLHESALAKGTLKEDFEEEIEKSWKEYVEQVGAEMAEGDGQELWRQALNDVLAKGEELF